MLSGGEEVVIIRGLYGLHGKFDLSKKQGRVGIL